MARYQLVGQNKNIKHIFRSTLNILAFTWIHAYDILKDSQSVDIWCKNKATELQFVSVTVGLADTPHQFSLLEISTKLVICRARLSLQRWRLASPGLL